MPPINDDNARAIHAWEANARFWDERMGDGNDFFATLLWPAVERLLRPAPGDRLLDAACGNGLTSRLLAKAGAKVTAFDASAAMIDVARSRPGPQIDYRVLDATDPAALSSLGAGIYDGALCNMALMDIAEIDPLMSGVAQALKPGGRFVFSILHPCFNNPATVQMGEFEDRGGDFVTTYSVKIARYMTPFTQAGRAMQEQPEPHLYFHRSLTSLLDPAFVAGLMLDGLEERAFPPDTPSGKLALSWSGHFSDIPAALVVRLRRPL